MRLHRLTLSGFGPFPGEVELDFDAVSADGLFLISGSTGAGKTSILDAVCFALYGRVAGVRNEVKSLRSHFAAASTPTFVELEFSTRGHEVRIRRSPEYERPRKRRGSGGTGMTVQKAGGNLWVKDGAEWAPRGRTLQEIGVEIESLVGFTAAQFTQLVLLPQGEFATFLRADPRDRLPILARLFDTERFGRVERILGESATEARREVEQVSRRRRDVIDAHTEVLGEHLPTSTVPDPDAGAVAHALACARQILREYEATARHVLRSAEDLETMAAGEHAGARRRVEDRRHLEHVRELEADYARRAPARAAAAEDLDTIERAARARPALLAWRRACEELVALERDEDDIRTTLSELGEDPAPFRVPDGTTVTTGSEAEIRGSASVEVSDGDPDAAEVVAAGSTIPVVDGAEGSGRISAHELQERAHELVRALEPTARRLTTIAELEDRLSRCEADRVANARDADASRATAAELEAVLEEAEGLPAARAAAATRIERAEGRLELARRAQDVSSSLTAARKLALEREAAERTAKDRAESLTAEYDETRRVRLAGIAAELAAGLHEGEVCPVCGSVTHPTPARPGPGAVTKADEEAARVRWEEARARAESAASHAEAARTEVARWTAVSADLDVEDPEIALAAARDDLTASRHELERLDAQELRAAEARTRRTGIDARLAELETRRADLEHAHTSLVTRLEQIRSETTTDLDPVFALFPRVAETPPRTHAELGPWISFAEALAPAAGRLVAVHVRRSELTAKVRELELEASSALDAAGFSSGEEVDAAGRIDATAARRVLEDLRDLATRIELGHDDAAYGRALGDTCSAEDLALGVERSARAEDVARGRARAVRDRLVGMSQRVSDATARLEDFVRTTGPEEARLDELRQDVTLAEVVAGTSTLNTDRLPLSSFVLLDLFSEVVEGASRRLAAMSRGRYTFVHETRIQKRQTRSGLGLAILDDFTQERRDPRTLSGGESFMASLALALGLADTVSATKGGLELDTLFIDEGFGSLDPDSLAEVLGVLEELREGGRRIGLISHVTEMQGMFAHRISVTRSPTGSRLEVS